MGKIKSIIVDDEDINIENLKELLGKYCPNVQIAATANNINDALQVINVNKPDLVFLDIQLGQSSGFDLLVELGIKTFEVIFVTAYDHYTMKAIKADALDYILKPIDIQELVHSVSKAEKKITVSQTNEKLETFFNTINKDHNNDRQKIALPQQKEIRYVATEEIFRCEADSVYTLFFLTNGEKIMISKTLKEYTEILEPHNFIRTHNSHLVNCRYIKSWLKEDGGMILLTNGVRVPISKSHRERVRYILSNNS
jgi:two-component system, LytTR family, response regulator